MRTFSGRFGIVVNRGPGRRPAPFLLSPCITTVRTTRGIFCYLLLRLYLISYFTYYTILFPYVSTFATTPACSSPAEAVQMATTNLNQKHFANTNQSKTLYYYKASLQGHIPAGTNSACGKVDGLLATVQSTTVPYCKCCWATVQVCTRPY